MENEDEVDPTLEDQDQEDTELDENENQNDEDQDGDDSDDGDADEEGEETVESLKEKLAKAQKAYENQKIRAEKAEKEKKEGASDKRDKPTKKTPAKADDLSAGDLYALMERKVHSDDVEDVKKYAKFSNITVKEALDSDFVTRLLADKSQKRDTAKASVTGNRRAGQGKVSVQGLLANASKGKLPDSDEDLDRMIEARLESKRTRKKN